MLRNVKLRHKILALPAISGVALLLILVISRSGQSENADLMSKIELGFVPAVQLGRSLEVDLADIQRGFQDAVAAADESMLIDTENFQIRFRDRLEAGKEIRDLEHRRLESIAADFKAYYDLAEDSSRRMIGNEAGDSLIGILEEMQTKHNELVTSLEKFSADSDLEMQAAFKEARENSERTSTASNLTALLALAFIVALIVLSFWILRSVTGPLAKAVSISERASRGELATQIEVVTNDEIGQLMKAQAQVIGYFGDMARVADAIAAGNLEVEIDPRSAEDIFGHAFQKMIQNLRRMIGDLKGSAAQVASSAEEISASALQINKGAESQSSSTEETSSTMVEMAAQIDSVAQSTQSLAINVDETSASVHEMGATIEEVARNAESLLTSVSESSATIEEMIAAVTSIAEKVRRVEEVSSNAAAEAAKGGAELSQVINGIATSGKDIGKIVKLIQEIADQTNLLALNAAI